MVDILPFRGLRYNLDKLAAEGASLNDVATPPYDVINDAQQAAFYAKHPANFVRLDLNQKTPHDNAENNPYTRAAGFMAEWEQDSILIPEAQPALYAYSQSWDENGKRIVRKGMIGLLKLEEFAPSADQEGFSQKTGSILPHEHTLKGPKQDRIQLMRSTLCSLSQVFLIYSDPQRTLESLLYDQDTSTPWNEATDADGVVHAFRPVTDPAIIQQLQTLFREKALLIADGHHRYETALAYREEVREQFRKKNGHEAPDGSLLSDYSAVFLTNMDDPGLKVYPTHRILEQWPAGWDESRFEAELFKKYDIVESNETFSYRTAKSNTLLKLRLKPEATPSQLPPLLDTFDAALLEETVFKGIFHSTGEALKQDHTLGFHRNDDEIEALWASGNAVAGFYLAAPSVKLVHQICESGHRMPQKSTYFYPKILSGLLIYPYRRFHGSNQHALSGTKDDVQPVDASLTLQEAVFAQRPY